MSDVDRLFDEYRQAHRSGGDANPHPYLERLAGTDRAELAALIDGYLARAPGREWDAAAFADSRAKELTDRIAGGWGEPEPQAESEGWRELLPRLRNAAKIKRADLVARLAEAIGAPEQTEKVAAYYHQMETGKLPSEGVSDTVLDALGRIVGESAERIRRAGSVIGAGGDEGDVTTGVAFARKAVHDPTYVDASQATSVEAVVASAGDEDDTVDQLFTGGPEAG